MKKLLDYLAYTIIGLLGLILVSLFATFPMSLEICVGLFLIAWSWNRIEQREKS